MAGTKKRRVKDSILGCDDIQDCPAPFFYHKTIGSRYRPTSKNEEYCAGQDLQHRNRGGASAVRPGRGSPAPRQRRKSVLPQPLQRSCRGPDMARPAPWRPVWVRGPSGRSWQRPTTAAAPSKGSAPSQCWRRPTSARTATEVSMRSGTVCFYGVTCTACMTAATSRSTRLSTACWSVGAFGRSSRTVATTTRWKGSESLSRSRASLHPM